MRLLLFLGITVRVTTVAPHMLVRAFDLLSSDVSLTNMVMLIRANVSYNTDWNACTVHVPIKLWAHINCQNVSRETMKSLDCMHWSSPSKWWYNLIPLRQHPFGIFVDAYQYHVRRYLNTTVQPFTLTFVFEVCVIDWLFLYQKLCRPSLSQMSDETVTGRPKWWLGVGSLLMVIDSLS